jgi:hydrogenase expression/formation protein HypD
LSQHRLRNRETTEKIVNLLKAMDLKLSLMHVCGTHQDTLIRHGLDTLLKDCGVSVRQGPGCPVCVTTAKEYEEAAALARNGAVVTSYGDASRVPGRSKSLLDLRAEGCDVRIVYGIHDAVKIAEKTQNSVVFLAVGFETTAPSTAVTILSEPPENFSILSCHRYVPPALDTLLDMGEVRLHGLIEPGHVSAIIGLRPYEGLSKKYCIPQVIAGFEPLDILMAVYMLALQNTKGEARVENEYSRVVRREGNTRALKALNEVFEPFDVPWRGFPSIPLSGMRIRRTYANYDARKIHEDELKDMNLEEIVEQECKCGEVLRGVTEPKDCPLFGAACTPIHPIGPCMVSIEGSCNIEFKYDAHSSRIH